MQDYSNTTPTKGKHLTYQDSLNIERWHNKEGMSNQAIARLLNKVHGTIDNEIKRDNPAQVEDKILCPKGSRKLRSFEDKQCPS